MNFVSRFLIGIIFTIAAIYNFYFLCPLSLDNSIDLNGQTILVTGSNSGIGLETARHIYQRNGHVLLGVRTLEKGNIAKLDIESTGSGGKLSKITVIPNLDLCDHDSVKAFAKSIGNIPIHSIINNAGLGLGEYIPNTNPKTNKMDMSFVCNCVNPYLLTRLLDNNLIKGASNGGINNDGYSRVIFTSSFMAYIGSLDEAVVNGSMTIPSAIFYSSSKLCDTTVAIELDAFYKENGMKIRVNGVSPGYVMSDLDRNTPFPLNKILIGLRIAVSRKTPEGAIPQTSVAISPQFSNVGGKHFEDSCIMSGCKDCMFFCQKDGGAILPSDAKDPNKRKNMYTIVNKFAYIQNY